MKHSKTLKRSEFLKFFSELSPDEVSFDGVAYTLVKGTKRYIAEPPFPPTLSVFPPRNSLLQEHLDSRPKIAVVLIRYGEDAIGLFEGTELLVYKTGSHFIRGRTKAGGQSSARYSRIRAGQRAEFLEGVSFALDVLLGPKMNDVSYVFFGGARDTANALVKHSALLQKNKIKIQERMIPARHADFEALRASAEDVWSFRVEELS